jgi:hypothetical protein
MAKPVYLHQPAE